MTGPGLKPFRGAMRCYGVIIAAGLLFNGQAGAALTLFVFSLLLSQLFNR
jgi:hypothetical protein